MYRPVWSVLSSLFPYIQPTWQIMRMHMRYSYEVSSTSYIYRNWWQIPNIQSYCPLFFLAAPHQWSIGGYHCTSAAVNIALHHSHPHTLMSPSQLVPADRGFVKSRRRRNIWFMLFCSHHTACVSACMKDNVWHLRQAPSHRQPSTSMSLSSRKIKFTHSKDMSAR